MEQRAAKAYIADVYPDKAQYRMGESVEIFYGITSCLENFKGHVEIKIMVLDECLINMTKEVDISGLGTARYSFCYEPQHKNQQGFGVDIDLYENGGLINSLSTAFDVAESWYLAPRYGFLSDFYKDDENDETDVKQMAKYHINVVQYYDWMYRHDTLIPKEDYFVDPLGRNLSLPAVKSKINACRKFGMHSVAYGAVYGASRDFFEKHRDWALYNNKGEAEGFEGWLYIMNISPESPWSEHIVEEYGKCVKEIGFDGIHMDTYGYPKTDHSRLNGKDKLERLEEQFPLLIKRAQEKLKSIKEDTCLIFNAVNNWPVDAVAPTEQDAVYIEVWPPNDRYVHLNSIIKHARETGKKQTILAAYLKPFKDADTTEPFELKSCFCLASAAINASGGYHLLLGEKNKILSEAYYARHSNIPDELIRSVRNYYDFIVRYENLLFDLRLADISMTFANGINDDILFENGSFSSCGDPDKIWTIVKEMPGYTVINLINLTGVKSDKWNEPKENEPTKVEDIIVKAIINEPVKGIYTASPDIDSGRPHKLEYELLDSSKSMYTVFKIPRLIYWDLVYIIT